MHKIDGDGHVNGQFALENPATGQQPTVVTADWLNAVQGELLNLLLDAGLAPSRADNSQVLQAVRVLIARVVNSSPAALDTLSELAAALGNDANFATTVTNALAAKASTTGTNATGTWSIDIGGNAKTVTGGVYTTGDQTIAGTKTFQQPIAGSVTGTATGVAKTVTGTTAADLVSGAMADNDLARIRVGGDATNAGWLEIATADDGDEPIYVRQYIGLFSQIARTLTLLDRAGNTSVPGALSAAGGFIGNASSASRLAPQGDYANNAPGTTRGQYGLAHYQVYANGYPTQYGNLIHLCGLGAGQLLLGWSGSDGNHASNYIRSKRDNDTGAWSPWAEIVTSVNYNSYAPTLIGGGASGNWSINAASATNLTGDQTSWAMYRSSAVANMLGWNCYGNGHVIFDASKGKSPTGSTVGNADAAVPWSTTYPTLMGWNGYQTYGVRVDSARVADSAAAVAWTGVAGRPTSTVSIYAPSGGVDGDVWYRV